MTHSYETWHWDKIDSSVYPRALNSRYKRCDDMEIYQTWRPIGSHYIGYRVWGVEGREWRAWGGWEGGKGEGYWQIIWNYRQPHGSLLHKSIYMLETCVMSDLPGFSRTQSLTKQEPVVSHETEALACITSAEWAKCNIFTLIHRYSAIVVLLPKESVSNSSSFFPRRWRMPTTCNRSAAPAPPFLWPTWNVFSARWTFVI